MRNNLKKFRNEVNITLQEFADMYGGTKANCWNLEENRSNPTLLTAYAIAKILNKTVYEIWPDETEVIEETTIVRRIKKGTPKGPSETRPKGGNGL